VSCKEKRAANGPRCSLHPAVGSYAAYAPIPKLDKQNLFGTVTPSKRVTWRRASLQFVKEYSKNLRALCSKTRARAGTGDRPRTMVDSQGLSYDENKGDKGSIPTHSPNLSPHAK